MRILLDQNCPQRVGRMLTGHDVETAYRMGWPDLTNGELLETAEAAGFELLLTADRRIRTQQNLAQRKIALVVLSLNNRSVLLRHIDLVQTAVDRAKPGSFEEVEIPRPPLLRRTWPNR